MKLGASQNSNSSTFEITEYYCQRKPNDFLFVMVFMVSLIFGNGLFVDCTSKIRNFILYRCIELCSVWYDTSYWAVQLHIYIYIKKYNIYINQYIKILKNILNKGVRSLGDIAFSSSPRRLVCSIQWRRRRRRRRPQTSLTFGEKHGEGRKRL